MEKETLKRIFEFLEDKEDNNPPFKWKLLNNEPLTEDDLYVKGDLILTESPLTSLPEGLIVGGSLDLSNSKIKLLPEGLKIAFSLYLLNSRIKSLPEGLKVGWNLSLRSSTFITLLPKGLEVGGGLFIRNTPLLDYTNEELKEMVKPGFIKGEIHRK